MARIFGGTFSVCPMKVAFDVNMNKIKHCDYTMLYENVEKVYRENTE